MTLEDDISKIKGIGPSSKNLFNKLGIYTINGLIEYYPKKYDDYSNILPTTKLTPGLVTIKAKITQISGKYVRRGLHITEAIAIDDYGSVRLVWFNQPYRASGTKINQKYFISGNFELSYKRFVILNPSTELVNDFPVNTARVVPVYKETKGLKSNQIRKAVKEIATVISKIEETLPDWLIKDNNLISKSSAILGLHFPDSKDILASSKHRVAFEEVFELILTSLLLKNQALINKALPIPFKEKLAQDFVKNLGFKLTDEQKKVIWQIYKDIQKDAPMNRLVEGDVGSGKTVVAVMAALMAMEQNYQVAFMAPTEILARQHAETIFNMLKRLGFENQVSLLVGGMKSEQKNKVYKHIKSGEIKLLIGTHALIQEKVDMHNLALVIIDEQHRFGVEQRKKLLAKAGHMPHVLSMTATPIPRSLALTLYGELDISIISSKPRNRKEIITKLVSPNSLDSAYTKVKEELKKGKQAFVVCPLISESTSLDKIKSAKETYDSLKIGVFKDYSLGLLHGKMKAEEKNNVMQDFLDKKYHILVSTTVIEVGVDVPNATVMLIQNADRFGLAQLHQLRGRVGRSEHQGYCFPILSDSKAPSKRLRAFEQTKDGFRLSELDLELRGPGAIYGTFQHGQLDLRIAKLTDTKLIISARKAAQKFIDKQEDLLQYSHLANRVKAISSVTNLN